MIRRASMNDYLRIAISINRVSKNSPYINKELLYQDIKNNSCFVYEKCGKIVSIGSIVFDPKYQMDYIKRVCVMNQKNKGKGIAKEMIKYLQSQSNKIAVTPWKDNLKMIAILEEFGFERKYEFQENFVLYQKEIKK